MTAQIFKIAPFSPLYEFSPPSLLKSPLWGDSPPFGKPCSRYMKNYFVSRTDSCQVCTSVNSCLRGQNSKLHERSILFELTILHGLIFFSFFFTIIVTPVTWPWGPALAHTLGWYFIIIVIIIITSVKKTKVW